MKRSELEHIIRASGTIVDDSELVIIGSQSILGQFPDAPNSLPVSIAADVFPRNKPELSDLVDGPIGESSFFHEQFGYYAQGVGPETAIVSDGWEQRLVRILMGYQVYALKFMILQFQNMLLVAQKIWNSPVNSPDKK